MSSKYGPFKRKIDLYTINHRLNEWEYRATTTWAKNLEDAVLKYSDILKVPEDKVRAFYSPE